MKLSNVTVALPSGSGFGWGVCGDNLTSRLQAMGASKYQQTDLGYTKVDGTILQAIGSHEFSMTAPVFGKWMTVGYGFIENDIIAKKYLPMAYRLWNRIISGSTWMNDTIFGESGNSPYVCLQGVDTSVFRPLPIPAVGAPFTIGSFGKFEYRKGQDIVLKAVSLFRERHPEVRLVTAWGNQWPQLATEMWAYNDTRIPAKYTSHERVSDGLFFADLADDCGFSPLCFKSSLNLTPEWMAKLYNSCDVALFPNRCEAGQNLCLSEALACGTPCIVTDATGHKDITRAEDYPCKDLLLRGGKDYIARRMDLGLDIGNWHSPCLEEIVSQLEYSYRGRWELYSRRAEIAEFGSRYTWDASAKKMAALLV